MSQSLVGVNIIEVDGQRGIRFLVGPSGLQDPPSLLKSQKGMQQRSYLS